MRWALKKTKNNKLQAAKLLGVSIRSFRMWEIKYGFRPPGVQSQAIKKPLPTFSEE